MPFLLHNTIFRIIFAVTKKHKQMEQEVTMTLTREEANLINAIRNCVSAFPNGYEHMLDYAQRLFDALIDPFEGKDD